MSIQDLIDFLGRYQWVLLIVFGAIPLAALLSVLVQGKRSCKQSKIRYVYTFLVYLSCIPGIFSAVLTAYVLFFLRTDLLQLSVTVYFLPLVSMVITLIIINKKNNFSDIPGFGRIQGLMIMLAVSFAAAFLLSRVIVIIAFFGGFINLLFIALVVFILLKVAAHKMKAR